MVQMITSQALLVWRNASSDHLHPGEEPRMPDEVTALKVYNFPAEDFMLPKSMSQLLEGAKWDSRSSPFLKENDADQLILAADIKHACFFWFVNRSQALNDMKSAGD